MSTSLSNCRFCSVVSKKNDEDPIGSAGYFDHWLIFETPLPWKTNIWLEPDPIPKPVILVLKSIWEDEIKMRTLAIAPDREYSQPGYTRLLYYRRPAAAFARFEKFEYVLPVDAVTPLVVALIKQPEQLPEFEQYQQDTSHIRDLMVCTHGNVDAACARFGYPIYRQLRQKYAVASAGTLRVWQCSHFGGHRFAPTLVDLPEARYWGHLELGVLDALVKRDRPVTELRFHYRGWGGMTKFEQIVEREIWMREGWEWLEYYKSGQILAMDEDKTWAEVRINFTAPNGSLKGAYEAKVEVSGQVMTASWTSSEDDQEPIEAVNQYRVSRLVKV